MGIMHHIIFTFLISGLSFFLPATDEVETPKNESDKDRAMSLYGKCQLEGKLDFEIFEDALKSLAALEFDNESVVTIIDFSKPSTEKRLFVIDLKNENLLHHTLVAHGKNSGLNEAEKFSNTCNSLQSSLGLYSTGKPYIGKHGYSLRLNGLEKGINDNAQKRAIVIHGAEYVSSDFIEDHGRLGRSWGCPAIPVELTKEIIDLIKNGSCLYIYANDEN